MKNKGLFIGIIISGILGFFMGNKIQDKRIKKLEKKKIQLEKKKIQLEKQVNYEENKLLKMKKKMENFNKEINDTRA